MHIEMLWIFLFPFISTNNALSEESPFAEEKKQKKAKQIPEMATRTKVKTLCLSNVIAKHTSKHGTKHRGFHGVNNTKTHQYNMAWVDVRQVTNELLTHICINMTC